ncbi:MAG: response regulator [Rhodocyclaceae bacterium]|nr:response regulator [Rhodocyclaceae bacterium]
MKLRPNITVKLVGYLLVAAIVPLLVLGVSALEIARRVVIDQAQQANLVGLGRFSAYLRLYHDQIEDLAANVAGNEAISRSLRAADGGRAAGFDALNTRVQVGYILNSYVRTKGLVSLDLFSVGGEHFHVGETLQTGTVRRDIADSMLIEALSAATPTLWRGIGPNINSGSRFTQVTSVARVIRDFSPKTGRNDTVGVMVISLSDEIMSEYLRDTPLADGRRLMAVDHHGKIMLHSDIRLVGQPLSPALLELVRTPQGARTLRLDNEEVLMDVLPWRGAQGYLVSIVPRRLLTAGTDTLVVTTGVLLLAGLLVIMLMTLRYARTVVAPIKAVSEGFEALRLRPDAAHQPLTSRVADEDEIGQLVRGYNNHLEALRTQREATEELRESEAARRATETMLTAAIEAIGEGFVVYDAEDRLLFFNEKYREIYRDSAPVMVPGNSFETIVRYGLAQGRYPEAAGHEEEWLAERLRVHRESNRALEQQLPDGRWVRIVERKTPLGQIVGFRIDITELKRAQQAAEAASQAKSNFLANMSHEIRTPMNAMLGMMQFAREAHDEQERKMLIDKALNSAQILLTLINEILDFSKIEAGKLDIERIVWSPARLMDEVRDLFGTSARDKGLALAFASSAEIPEALWGDPLRVRQVLQNLLSNALKFTAEGSVEVAFGRRGQCLRVSVTDQGIGISDADQARLFESFSQADASTTRRFGGTGLGLAISKRLIELMGGEIGVISTPGHGSTFWFELPMEAAPPEQLPVEVNVDTGTLLKALAGKHVLLVEDNRMNQEVALRFLARAGISAVVAENGAEALDTLATQRFDAVLMDCQMPVMDGYEATRQLRADARYATLPVLAMTANALVGDRERSLAAGMNDHLTKPLVADQFYRLLGRWLLGKAAREASTTGVVKPVPGTPSGTQPGPVGGSALPGDATTVRLDIDQALRQMAGMRDLFNDVARIFPEEALAHLAALAERLSVSDFAVAMRAAHSIKGMAASIGATQLRALALGAETACKQNAQAAALATLPALESELNAVIAELNAYLASPAAELASD